MTLPYLLRLLGLCSAAFFFIHAACGVAVKLFAPSAVRLADRLRARAAARFLFVLRLLPTALAAIVVLGLCLPSYLWLEPGASNEKVGIVFIFGAMLGVAVLTLAGVRAIRAISSTIAFLRACKCMGKCVNIPGEIQSALVLEGDSTVLAMVGIIRPRLVISRRVISALTPEQLAAAARHEQAHRSSRENLKRFFLLLMPEIVPFFRFHSAMDHAWAKFSEWAADDSAVAGDSRHSVSLAEALVRVARLGVPGQLAPLCTSLVPADQDLFARVERLLHSPLSRLQPRPGRYARALVASFGLVTTTLLATLLLRPPTLHFVHEVLEKLTH
jgi:beta-lactamase regulating signal transducer with metallopeptidase domain